MQQCQVECFHIPVLSVTQVAEAFTESFSFHFLYRAFTCSCVCSVPKTLMYSSSVCHLSHIRQPSKVRVSWDTVGIRRNSLSQSSSHSFHSRVEPIGLAGLCGPCYSIIAHGGWTVLSTQGLLVRAAVCLSYTLAHAVHQHHVVRVLCFAVLCSRATSCIPVCSTHPLLLYLDRCLQPCLVLCLL